MLIALPRSRSINDLPGRTNTCLQDKLLATTTRMAEKHKTKIRIPIQYYRAYQKVQKGFCNTSSLLQNWVFIHNGEEMFSNYILLYCRKAVNVT